MKFCSLLSFFCSLLSVAFFSKETKKEENLNQEKILYLLFVQSIFRGVGNPEDRGLRREGAESLQEIIIINFFSLRTSCVKSEVSMSKWKIHCGISRTFKYSHKQHLTHSTSTGPVSVGAYEDLHKLLIAEKIHELIKNTFEFNDDWKVEIFMSTPPRRSVGMLQIRVKLAKRLLGSWIQSMFAVLETNQ